MTTPADVVAALQLLMSDMDKKARFHAFQDAFHRDTMVLYSFTDSLEFGNHMQKLFNLMHEMRGIVRGSSLGHEGVQRVHSCITDALHIVKIAANMTGTQIHAPST